MAPLSTPTTHRLGPPWTIILLVALLSSLAGCGAKESATTAGQENASSARMNIVLITIDSLRRDHLGVYGHQARYAPDIPVSPNLDALAAEGVVFEDAWTTSSWTLPTHMSLMTGLSDRRHGVETDRFKLDPQRQTLAETLHQAGWKTAGYFSGPYLDPKYGFGRGFEDYQSAMITPADFAHWIQEEDAKRIAQGRRPMDQDVVKRMRDRMSHMDITSPKINNLATTFINQQGTDPFFLFLHYFDAHYDHIPWRMEPGLGKSFDPGYSKTGAQAFDGTNWYFDERVMDGKAPYTRRISDRDLNHVIAFYDAEIHWVDRHIGEIIRLLKAKGLWDNTILMVVADHGDEFFDHNSIGHRSTLFAEECRIPMILRVPGQTPAGRRIAALSRIYDSAPTLLDYAHAPPLEQAEGRSLRPMMEAKDSPRFALQRIFSGGHRRAPRQLNVRDGWRNTRYTVLRQFRYDQAHSSENLLAVIPMNRRSTGDPYLVFDRQQDPKELRPLNPSDPRYAEAIQAFCRDFRASEKDAQKLSVSPLEQRLSSLISAEDQAVLNELGYIESSSEKESTMDRPLAPLPEPCP